MDIVIIRDVLPQCTTWRDVAHFVKQNLNPRTVDGYRDVVRWNEIEVFFGSCGLEDRANAATHYLKDLGFIHCESAQGGNSLYKFLI